MTLQQIPVPTNFRRTVAYALTVFLVGGLVVVIFFPIQGPWMTIAFLALVVALPSYLLLKVRGLKRYSYDEKGVYLKGRQLFSWRQVRRISLKFDESTGSYTPVAPPTWAAVLSGPVIQRETWVSYRAAMVFTLQTGKVISIQSNLDRMTNEGVIQRIDNLAKTDNPNIEFE